MDGYPLPKIKTWRGQQVSETRYYVNTWMEAELPLIEGNVLNIGAGGSQTPKQLLDFSKVTLYKTFDKEYYGDSKNPVDIVGDVMDMPSDMTNFWDAVLCIEVMECVENPFKAMDEIYRILKPNSSAYITCPFNYCFFGYGSNPNSLKIKNHVKDYWRPTKQGWGAFN